MGKKYMCLKQKNRVKSGILVLFLLFGYVIVPFLSPIQVRAEEKEAVSQEEFLETKTDSDDFGVIQPEEVAEDFEMIEKEEVEKTFEESSKDEIEKPVGVELPSEEESTTFYYEKGHKAKCYYKDEYFQKSSYEYNPSLSTMSMCLALSAFASFDEEDYAKKSKNVRRMLNKVIGIEEEQIKVNEAYMNKPEMDTIGVIAGNKKIQVEGKEYTLLVTAIRGGGYEREWASNCTLGRTGRHAGFENAKNQVLDFLRFYIAEKGITGDVKIWITGYSRAGATTNLVAGALDSGERLSDDIHYELDDIYAYCMEPPAGAILEEVKDKEVYNNIFNIINLSDPVPYVAPAYFGFARYGRDYILPSKARNSSDYDKLKEKMLKIYHSLEGEKKYLVDDFQMKEIGLAKVPGKFKLTLIKDDKKNKFSQGVFLSNYITIIAKEYLKDRNHYVDFYQDKVREICNIFFGSSKEELQKFKLVFMTQVNAEWTKFAKAYFNPFGTEEKALKILANWVKRAAKDAGITGYDEEVLERGIIYMSDLLIALITSHPDYFVTLTSNMEGIGEAHYPELCYAWLASMDENYNEIGK